MLLDYYLPEEKNPLWTIIRMEIPKYRPSMDDERKLIEDLLICSTKYLKQSTTLKYIFSSEGTPLLNYTDIVNQKEEELSIFMSHSPIFRGCNFDSSILKKIIRIKMKEKNYHSINIFSLKPFANYRVLQNRKFAAQIEAQKRLQVLKKSELKISGASEDESKKLKVSQSEIYEDPRFILESRNSQRKATRRLDRMASVSQVLLPSTCAKSPSSLPKSPLSTFSLRPPSEKTKTDFSHLTQKYQLSALQKIYNRNNIPNVKVSDEDASVDSERSEKSARGSSPKSSDEDSFSSESGDSISELDDLPTKNRAKNSTLNKKRASFLAPLLIQRKSFSNNIGKFAEDMDPDIKEEFFRSKIMERIKNKTANKSNQTAEIITELESSGNLPKLVTNRCEEKEKIEPVESTKDLYSNYGKLSNLIELLDQERKDEEKLKTKNLNKYQKKKYNQERKNNFICKNKAQFTNYNEEMLKHIEKGSTCLFHQNIPRLVLKTHFGRGELHKLYSKFKALSNVTAIKTGQKNYQINSGIDFETLQKSTREISFENELVARKIFEELDEDGSGK